MRYIASFVIVAVLFALAVVFSAIQFEDDIRDEDSQC